jgi:hypothetical protein
VLYASITIPLYAQTIPSSEKNISKEKKPAVRIKTVDESLLDENTVMQDYVNADNLSAFFKFIHPPPLKTEEKGFQSLVSSFRNNIRFGGFWDKYAIINFSPSVFVKPFDFINIFGNQNTCYLIPINEIKNEMKSLCIRSAAILAVDNACRFFLGSNELVPAIANFALKAAVLQLLKSTTSSEVIHENSFYYAVSIRF